MARIRPHGKTDRDLLDYEYVFKSEELMGERLEFMMVNQSNTDWFYWVDACCGEGGAIRRYLAKYGSEERILGIDRWKKFSPQNEEIASKYEKMYGKRSMYDFLEADISDVVVPRKASIMTCAFGITWVDTVQGPSKKKLDAIKNLFQYVKVGGKFMFCDFGEYRKSDFSKIERLLKAEIVVWKMDWHKTKRPVSSIMLVKR